MQQSGCEVRILSLHRGAEYRIKPNKIQTQLAHELIEAGADIILGGHSHVPGSYERYLGKPIFYSFGNMLFDQDRGKSARGTGFDYIFDHQLQRKTVATYIPLLAGITISKHKHTIEISEPDFRMARVDKGIYSPLDEKTQAEILEKIGAPQSDF